MRTRFGQARVCLNLIFFLAAALGAARAANAEPVSLKRAVQLALAHSARSAQAQADEQRAAASYREAKNQYLPQLMVGSGLGDTWGYPLSLEGSAPSLFNVTAQSALFNPALRDFMRAARTEYGAAAEQTKDRRNQITEDTVLAYLELVKWERELKPLREQYEGALKMQEIADQRVQAGVESLQQAKQAELVSARTELRITQAEGAIDVLRANLAQLTGIPESSFETDPRSIPSFPEIAAKSEAAARAEQSSPAVQFAEQHAIAESFRARAEHRSLWPTADFAAQYALLAKFNNWEQFFRQGAFQPNNASVGVVLRFPFLNPSQRARAQGADLDALHAKHEVESTKNQVSQQTLRLRSAVEQMAAARKVSELEYEIARTNADSLQIRMTSGTATITEGGQAQAELSEKLDALADANFEFEKARVNLLRSTGELESWVDQGR
ncbi:MAG: TolC family protein [Acidobacteria bacterium]|nr:TolC family protein [Acidobacteriota bacterium]